MSVTADLVTSEVCRCLSKICKVTQEVRRILNASVIVELI
jgi:hypothetical protein